MSSQKKAEASRRNGKTSSGPKSEQGKNRSRLNALKHGMRANLLVLPGEDPEACQGRIDAWTDSLCPRNEAELYLAERAARITLQLDRIERAHVARVSVNINNAAAGVTQPSGGEEDVFTLGRRLFWDARGPLALYPHSRMDSTRQEPHVSWSGDVNDANDPGRLVYLLESTDQGCGWLIDRWAELRLILEQGQPWRSPDKLKAARLLGRQPADALYDPTVGAVFLACHKIDPSGGELFHEIWLDMNSWEVEAIKKRLKSAPPDSMSPHSEAKPRLALLKIVDESVARLKRIAEGHRQRADANAGLTADLLAFDATAEGERLRRYEISCSRTLIRTLDAFDKMHRSADADDSEDFDPPIPAGTNGCVLFSAASVEPDVEIDPALIAEFAHEPTHSFDPIAANAIDVPAEPACAVTQSERAPAVTQEDPELSNEPTAPISTHDNPELPNVPTAPTSRADNPELPNEPTALTARHDNLELPNEPTALESPYGADGPRTIGSATRCGGSGGKHEDDWHGLECGTRREGSQTIAIEPRSLLPSGDPLTLNPPP